MRVSRVAAGESLVHARPVLFWCNASWDPLEWQRGKSVEELKESAHSVATVGSWVETGVDKVHAETWVREFRPLEVCAFCDTLLEDVSHSRGRRASICRPCLLQMAALEGGAHET